MRLRFSLIALSALAAHALAAQDATAPPVPAKVPAAVATSAAKSASAPMPLGSDAQPADEGALNPFTGRRLSLEQKMRILDQAKVETALIDEQRRQLELRLEIDAMPRRKKAEMDKLQAPPGLPAIPGSASTPPATAKAPPSKSKAATPAVNVVAPAPAAPPPQPTVDVSSIYRVGPKMGALVTIDGDTLSVTDGDRTALGPVKIVDASTVRLGNTDYQVHAKTIGRVYAAPVRDTTGAGASPRPANTPATAATPQAVPGTVLARPAGASGSGVTGNFAPVTLPPLPPVPAVR